MFSFLRDRLGIPGVVSVIALVFAMMGGAFAASDNGTSGEATASAKKGKQGPRGPKGPRGPIGPAGPQGPAGSAGAKGDTGAKGDAGANGTNGTSGTSGKSAETVTFAGSKGSCAEGGIEVKSASPTVLVCNGVKGADGESGFTATLPPGETETGSWGGSIGDGEYTPVAISFPIPLSAPMPFASTDIVEIGDPPDANCPGTAVTPEAAPGRFCLYVLSEEVGITNKALSPPSGGAGVGTPGAILALEGTSGAWAAGSWAVTAPGP